MQGFDAGRLARIKPWMQRWVDQGKFPGAQCLIARRGEVVYRDQAGLRDVAGGVPWAPDTIARIYSMTKPITSVALLMLYEDALCHLDTPLDEFLPEFAEMEVLISGAERIDQTRPAETRLTLHHLLTHTSGMTYGFNEDLLGATMTEQRISFAPRRPAGVDGFGPGEGDEDLADMVRQLSDLPLAFEPGSRWNYGVSTDVLGRVVEVITGQSLDRVFAERILGPLGMDDTFFAVPEAKQDRFAHCYIRTPDDPMALMDTPGGAFAEGAVKIFSGGGGLCSTIDDYLIFAEMLRRNGAHNGTRLLAPKTVELMTRNALGGDLASMGQPVFSEVSFEGIGFGLGVSVTLDPGVAKTLSSEGDYGWGGVASTVFWVDPALEMTTIFFTQLVPSSSYPVRKEIRAMTYSSLVDTGP